MRFVNTISAILGISLALPMPVLGAELSPIPPVTIPRPGTPPTEIPPPPGLPQTFSMKWTNVPPGKYVLEDEVNAEHLFRETNYANNASAIEVNVPNRTGRGGNNMGQLTPKKFVPYHGGCKSCANPPVAAAH